MLGRFLDPDAYDEFDLVTSANARAAATIVAATRAQPNSRARPQSPIADSDGRCRPDAPSRRPDSSKEARAIFVRHARPDTRNALLRHRTPRRTHIRKIRFPLANARSRLT
jgi:hypothetical protein